MREVDRRAKVKRMVERAKESDEGAIEWTCWYLKQSAFISDDPSWWLIQSELGQSELGQSNLELFDRKGLRRKPEDGELTLTREAMEVIKAAMAAGTPVTLPPNPYERPQGAGRGIRPGDYSRRDRTIKGAARFLVRIGYRKMRNAATRSYKSGKSAASIISKALAHLGVTLRERPIQDDILGERPKRSRR